MANVVLIGATGFVGSAILNELLSRGHKVTAVVRNISKLPKNDNLTAVQEDVANVDAIAKIAKGKDAVISAYNPGWNNPQMGKINDENYPKIVEAVKKAGVGRLLIVGGAGTLFVKPGVRVVDTGVIPAEIIDAVRSLGNFYLHYLTKEHDLDWVFFSPAGAFEEAIRVSARANSAWAKTTSSLTRQQAQATSPSRTMPWLWSTNWRSPLTTRSVSPSDTKQYDKERSFGRSFFGAMDISRDTDRRIGSTPCLEKKAHEHDTFTKTNKTLKTG